MHVLCGSPALCILFVSPSVRPFVPCRQLCNMKTKKCKTVENPESISTFHSAGESEVDGRIMSALGILSSMLKTDDASFPYC